MYQPPQNPDEPGYPPPQQPSYPPQGYPPQQPYYPPLYGPPPQKKSRTWLWIVLGVLVVLILGCIGVSTLVLRSAGTAINTVATSVASTVTTSSSSSNSSNATKGSIGTPVVVDSDWTVTLNSVKTNTGSQFDQPKAGNIFLVVNVTLHNTSSTTQPASTAIQWSLKDSTGQTYNQDITFGGGPDGTIAAGGLLRGNIAYEVPKSVHSFILQFVAGIGSKDLAEWNVSI